MGPEPKVARLGSGSARQIAEFLDNRIPRFDELVAIAKRNCNVFVETGIVFCQLMVKWPELAQAMYEIMAQQIPNKVIWGTDSVWYGSPQWQIEAFLRLQIRGAKEDFKRKVMWENASHIFPNLAYNAANKDTIDSLRRDYFGIKDLKKRYEFFGDRIRALLSANECLGDPKEECRFA